MVLLADLADDDGACFLSQRARGEGAVGAARGHEVERRAEGSALIVSDRSFTDVPFPSNSTIKQVALLLCDVLAAAGPNGELSCEALRDAVANLVRTHGRHWDRDAGDPQEIAALTTAATEVLLSCDLARRSGSSGLSASPLAARFRSPKLRPAGSPA